MTFFSPCSPTHPTCDDASVGILQHIFGPIIDVLARGTDPNTVHASSSLLGSIFMYYNTGVLAVASLIISYVAAVGAINTANDGEAMGKQWSAVWTPLRIVTGGAVLLPTASGYSFLQMFVLTLSLWGIGFANGCMNIAMSWGIIKPNNIVATSAAAPSSTFGMRAFAKQYLPVAYCARAANSLYADQMGTPSVQANPQADRINTLNGRVNYTFFIKDRNPTTNLAGGDPVCGTVKLSTYTYEGAASANGTSVAIATLQAGLSAAKAQAAMALMSDIDAWVATMPKDVTQAGWETIESQKLNAIVKQREDALASQITDQVSSSTADVDNGIKTVIEDLTRGGWLMAGGWYQRASAIRKALGKAVSEPVGNASEPSLSALPDDARTQLLRSSVTTVSEGIIKKSEEPGKGYNGITDPVADIASTIPRSAAGDINIGAIQQDIDSKFGSLINSSMKKVVDTATGSATDVDAVSRMQLVGESLALAKTSAALAQAGLLSSVAAVRATVAGVGGVQIMGTKIDGSGSMTALWDWLIVGPIKQIYDMLEYVDKLAFYFSVFLPSLPYTIFMITGVGWLLGVLQTVIAAPLWAVMHMRPSQTFVGSDQQGYLLLLALFVRPALAVIGLVAAMLVADPIVDFISQAFFSMRGSVVTADGFVGAVTEFVTLKWWLLMFAVVLLPVLYMIFGLPQVLPDHVLKWINAGVGDLGATQATSNIRGGLAMQHLQAQNTTSDGGRLRGSAAPTLPSNNPAGGGGGAARHEPLNAGDQGIAPINSGKTTGPALSSRSPSSSRSSLASTGEQGVAPANTGKAAMPSTIKAEGQGSVVNSDNKAVPSSAMNNGDNSVSTNPRNSSDAAISSKPMNSGDATLSTATTQSYDDVMQAARDIVERHNREKMAPSHSLPPPPPMVDLL